jgi:hypothetical protein
MVTHLDITEKSFEKKDMVTHWEARKAGSVPFSMRAEMLCCSDWNRCCGVPPFSTHCKIASLSTDYVCE